MGKKGLFKTKAEQRAYAIGRTHEFNKQNPMMNYAVVMKRTNFNNDGSFCSSFDHLVARTRTLKEAKESVDYLNKSHANANAHVMNAVKKKNVDMYDNRIEEYRVVKDKKRVGSVDYWDLQKGK